jgi:hypothetical protein
MKVENILDKRTGSIEFTISLFIIAGILINNSGNVLGLVLIFFGLSLYAIFYLLLSLRSSRRRHRIRSERQIGVIGYFVIFLLIVGIIGVVAKMPIAGVWVHIAMISSIAIILIIQIRKFKMGVISHPTTLLLYRMIFFWVLSFMAYYFLPYILY